MGEFVLPANPFWWAPYPWKAWHWSYGTSTGVAGRVYTSPIFFPRAVTISAIRADISVAGGAGTSLRLGLYEDNVRQPDSGALLADSGNINATTTGIKVFTFSSPIKRPKGFVHGCLETEDAVITFRRGSRPYTTMEVSGEKLEGYHYNQTYGALTDPCPATTLNSTPPFLPVRIDSIDR